MFIVLWEIFWKVKFDLLIDLKLLNLYVILWFDKLKFLNFFLVMYFVSVLSCWKLFKFCRLILYFIKWVMILNVCFVFCLLIYWKWLLLLIIFV